VGRGARRSSSRSQRVLPSFPVPQGHDEDSFLRELVTEGAKERYGTARNRTLIERIEFELDVIKSMASPRISSSCGISCATPSSAWYPSGPGRGSAADHVCVLLADRRHRPDPLRPAVRAVFLNPAVSRCPTSTWTSTRVTERDDQVPAAKYGSDRSRRSSRSRRSRLGPRCDDAGRASSTTVCARRQVAKAMPP